MNVKQVSEIVTKKDMRENNGEELKPCPFCGRDAELMEDVGDYPTTYRIGCKNEINPHYLDRWDETEKEAVLSWNTRHPDPVKAEIENDAVNSVLNVVAASSSVAEMEKTLTMIVSLGIALLRGLKGNQYIEDYLKAAIADTDNIVVVERQHVN